MKTKRKLENPGCVCRNWALCAIMEVVSKLNLCVQQQYVHIITKFYKMSVKIKVRNG